MSNLPGFCNPINIRFDEIGGFRVVAHIVDLVERRSENFIAFAVEISAYEVTFALVNKLQDREPLLGQISRRNYLPLRLHTSQTKLYEIQFLQVASVYPFS